jgi:hypothetical protein
VPKAVNDRQIMPRPVEDPQPANSAKHFPRQRMGFGNCHVMSAHTKDNKLKGEEGWVSEIAIEPTTSCGQNEGVITLTRPPWFWSVGSSSRKGVASSLGGSTELQFVDPTS